MFRRAGSARDRGRAARALARPGHDGRAAGARRRRAVVRAAADRQRAPLALAGVAVICEEPVAGIAERAAAVARKRAQASGYWAGRQAAWIGASACKRAWVGAPARRAARPRARAARG